METYTTALHLPFHQTPEINQEMSKLYSQLLAVLISEGKPMMQSLLRLNEDFEIVYTNARTANDVIQYYIKEFNLVINK